MKHPVTTQIIVPDTSLDATVIVNDDSRDHPADRVLAGQVGRLLWEHYPEWGWYVEIPPGQNVLIIRNLDCDPKGRMGMVIHKDKLGAKMHEVVMAAGEFLERYHQRRGRLEHGSIDQTRQIFEKPDE